MNGEEKLIAYVEDVVPSGAAHGNIAVFGDGGSLSDSGKKPSDFASSDAFESLRSLSTEKFSEVFGMIEDELSFKAYNSSPFAPGAYEEGDCCRSGGNGYVCVSGGTFDEFDPDDWKLVIRQDGIEAIDGVLAAYSNDGMARLLDIAPAFNPDKNYEPNQLAVKDGVLQRSTVSGRGVLALFTESTVEKTIANRIASLNEVLSDHISDSSVHVSSSDRSSWDGKVDSEGSGYSISDTGTNGVEVTTESGSNQKNYLFSKPGSDTSDTVVRMSDLPSVTAPSSSANPGDVAGAKATGEAIAEKRGLTDFDVDETGWVLVRPDGSVEWMARVQQVGEPTWRNASGDMELVLSSGAFYLSKDGDFIGDPVSGSMNTISLSFVTSDVPANTYSLRRGSRLALDADINDAIDSMPHPGISDPEMDGTADAGEADTFSRSDHVHPHDTSKQDALTFDSAPTTGSSNPVTSGGVKTAIDATLPLDTGDGKTVVGQVTFNQKTAPGGSIPRVVFSPNSSPYSIQVLNESTIAWCPSASDYAVMTLRLQNVLNNRRIEIVTVQEGSGQTWEIPIDPARMSGPNVVARISDIPDISRKRNYSDLTYVIEDMWVATVGSISVELYKTGDNTWASNSGKVTLERTTRSSIWYWSLDDEDGELVGGVDTNLSGKKRTSESDPTSITNISLYGDEDAYVASCVKQSISTMIAVESGMSITPGTGSDSDKTTIRLKQGLSATVLTQHQSLEGYAKLEDLEDLDLGADYTIETLSPTTSGSQITYDLKNRCVNVIEIGSTAAGFSISINQPDAESRDGTPVAREYLIVLTSELSSDVTVSVAGNVKDYAGNATSIVAFAGTTSIYRVFEFSRGSSRFVATGPNDPAYSAVKEIERALDDLLADGGTGTFTPGLFVIDEETGLYHKVTVVSDSETGEFNLGTDSTPVSR